MIAVQGYFADNKNYISDRSIPVRKLIKYFKSETECGKNWSEINLKMMEDVIFISAYSDNKTTFSYFDNLYNCLIVKNFEKYMDYAEIENYYYGYVVRDTWNNDVTQECLDDFVISALKKLDVEKPVPLDLWIKIAETPSKKYDNPLRILDIVNPEIMKLVDPGSLVYDSKFFTYKESYEKAEKYSKDKNSRFGDTVSDWLSVMKKRNKKDKKENEDRRIGGNLSLKKNSKNSDDFSSQRNRENESDKDKGKKGIFPFFKKN